MSVKKLLGQLIPPAGWEGRVKEAAYKPPKGIRIPFLFEDVSRETELRTTAFQFSGLDDAFIQQNGIGPREYPLRVIFSGNDHDLLATSFELALFQKGRGTLEHPLYGTFKVVPVGKVTRRNDLVQSANESVIEVVFSTSLASAYPVGFSFPGNELQASVAGFNVAAALQFKNATSLASAIQQASIKGSIRKGLGEIRQTMQSVSDQTAASKRAFDDNFRLVNEGVDVLVGQPLLLARQISDLTQAPARALAGIKSRLDGYGRLLLKLIGSNGPEFDSAAADTADALARRNAFRLADHIALSALGGSIIAAAETDFTNRPEAQIAALEIQRQVEQITSWREGRLATLGEIDTGEGYQAVQQAAAEAAGFLVELSFDLLPERAVVTDRARTVIDLCSELYGDLSDATVQTMIDTNRFTGSEILEVPKGRRVVWYAAA